MLDLINQLIAPDNAVGLKEPDGYTPRMIKILKDWQKEAERFKSSLVGQNRTHAYCNYKRKRERCCKTS